MRTGRRVRRAAARLGRCAAPRAAEVRGGVCGGVLQLLILMSVGTETVMPGTGEESECAQVLRLVSKRGDWGLTGRHATMPRHAHINLRLSVSQSSASAANRARGPVSTHKSPERAAQPSHRWVSPTRVALVRTWVRGASRCAHADRRCSRSGPARRLCCAPRPSLAPPTVPLGKKRRRAAVGRGALS